MSQIVTPCGDNDALEQLYPGRTKALEDRKQSQNTYLIHDNGGRPFSVTIDWPRKSVNLSGFASWSDEDIKHGYQPLREFKNVERVFLGPDTYMKNSETLRKRFLGNSILLEMKPCEYVLIQGMGVTSFTTDERITDFFSPVGPNDVPYPYAVSDNYMYFTSCRIHKSAKPKTAIRDFPTQWDFDSDDIIVHNSVTLFERVI